MKVCIVGSGSQGTGLAGLLAMEADVESLVLADYSEKNLEIASGLIQSLGEKVKVKEFRTEQVNAGDPQDVARVIHGCDVVFNGIIPKFNLPVMRACIQEKCHYLDLFAAPYEGGGVTKEETIGAQLELDEEFKRIGKTALPSIGMSPGWTSLASQYMIDGMEEVEDVIIRWGDYLDTEDFIAPVSPHVVYHEWFGAPYPVRTENGEAARVDLLESEEEFEFPQPIGRKKIYTVTSHPDIVLIPRFAGKPIGICEEKGGIFYSNLSMKDVWVKGIQAATSAQGDSRQELNMMEEFGKAFIPPIEYGKLLEEGRSKDHAVCFSVEVTGKKDGAKVNHICYYTSTLEEALKHLPWASPAVYGTIGGMPIELVLALGRGEIEQTGVWSIGNLGIAKKLNQAMAKRGQILTEKIERTMGY